MAITVKHTKVSTIPDGDDTSVVRPSDWNADHQLLGTVPVANGGTGASTLTGYVKGNGTSTMTASSTIPNTDITGLGTASTKDAGVANGVATLDSSGQVPLSQIPPLGYLNYQGTWNATTNTPTLTSSVGTKGYYYVVSVAGTTNLNGITDWQINDWVVYNGTAWQKIDNTDAVTSVNGYTGTVVLTQTDISGTVPTSRTITAGTGLSGGGDLSANRTLAIANTGVTATTYGSASSVPVVTVNAQGQITNATNTAIAIANTAVSGLGTMSTQNANAVAITGGNIDGTTIGGTTPAVITGSTINANTKVVSPDFYAQSVLGGNLRTSGGTSLVNWDGGGSGNVTINGGLLANPSNKNVSIAPTGTGTATINPATAGTMNNMVIGGTTPLAITGTTITATTFSGSGANLTSIPNSALVNSAITINGVSTALGGSVSVGTVTSVTGTSPVVSSGGANPAISMPAATTSVNGYLTSTDWNTFNNKQAAGTYVNSVSGTTSRITSTGGVTPVIDLASGVATAGTTGSATLIPVVTIDTYGRVTSITTAVNPQGTVTSVAATAGTGISVTGSPITTSGTLNITNTAPDQTVVLTNGTGISVTGTYPNFTVTNTAPSSGGTVTSVTATAPVSSTGGTTPVISMPAATTSVSGYLTSTDWTTFNGKQATLVSGTNIKTVGGVSLLGSGDAGTIGIGFGGTGKTSAPAAYAALEGYTTTATAAGTTTLTNASSYTQMFTGTTTQTVVMPVTSTLALGWTFEITNLSTGLLTINSSGGNLITTVASGLSSNLTCVLTTGTTAASWSSQYNGFNTVTGNGASVLAISPSLVTPDLGTPSSGVVTNLTGTASININGTVGATTANTGAFTTLSASSTVSGTGFSTYLASPPAIGGTAAAAITGTTITATKFVGVSGGTF